MTTQNPWQLIEDKFEVENQRKADNTFAIGNGLLTQLGCFEEFNSGNTAKGTFMEGIRTLNAFSNLPDWTSIILRLNAEIVDLSTCEIVNYQRILNMKEGVLIRKFRVVTPARKTIEVEINRFLSLANLQLGVIKYHVKSIDFQGNINFTVVLDGSVNERILPDAEPEWNVLQSSTKADTAHLWVQTRKTNCQVCEAVSFEFFKNNSLKKTNATKIEKSNIAGYAFGADVVAGESVDVVKYVAFVNSNQINYRELTANATQTCIHAKNKGWGVLLDENKQAWNKKWDNPELIMNGDLEKQKQQIIHLFRQLQFKNND